MPKFTQQHFEVAAKAVGTAYARTEVHGSNATIVKKGVRILQDELILAFKLDNPKFNENTFRLAIGQATVHYKQAQAERGWHYDADAE